MQRLPAPTWKTRKLRALTRMLYCSSFLLYCSQPTVRWFSLYCAQSGQSTAWAQALKRRKQASKHDVQCGG